MAPLMEIPERVSAAQLCSLTLSDFQASSSIHESLADQALNALSDSARTAAQLRSDRHRFAESVPIGGNRLCYSIDRGAVLAVYQEALKRLNSANHTQIQSETNLKVRTILGLRHAEPDDAVFIQRGMLLLPLEPQYSEPRLDFPNDGFQHKAAWRLNEWRKEGWPERYPAKAIELEKTRRGMLLDGDEGDVELLKRMRDWGEADWGNQIDASSKTDLK